MRQSIHYEWCDPDVRLTRVHVDAELRPGSLIELSGAAAAHLSKVLRMRDGAELVLFSGDGCESAASVDSVRGSRVQVLVGAARSVDRESPCALTLVQCIARADRMDVIVQKATELGVKRIVPVLSRRSVVRLDQKQALAKMLHWQAVAVSACEQCGRNRLPLIEPPRQLIAHLGDSAAAGLRLVLDPEAPGSPALAEPGTPVEVTIGPEGGFDAEELDALATAGCTAMRLGPRVLRTETAALAALTWLQVRYGDLG